MEAEPTTLGDVVRLMADVLRNEYGIDPEPVFARAGIDMRKASVSGSRVSRAAILRAWEYAAEATGDPSIGLVVGSHIRVTSFYALGFAFVTCDTLGEALDVVCRYYRVIANVPLDVRVVPSGDERRLEVEYSNPDYPQPQIPFDSFIASLMALVRLAVNDAIAPRRLELSGPDNGRGDAYEAVFRAPVMFNAPVNALVFTAGQLAAALPGRSLDLREMSDRVLADYLAALEPDQVTSEVRRLLLSLLPAGTAQLETIAQKLNMSRSTLQRRLHDENTNYKELLESTRKSLAIEYMRDRTYAISYIAFMLGFSDQSNFSRAFRRWTGLSPKAFRDRDRIE